MRLLGDRFVAGVLFTIGVRPFTVENRLHVMPIDRLWTSNRLMPGVPWARHLWRDHPVVCRRATALGVERAPAKLTG